MLDSLLIARQRVAQAQFSVLQVMNDLLQGPQRFLKIALGSERFPFARIRDFIGHGPLLSLPLSIDSTRLTRDPTFSRVRIRLPATEPSDSVSTCPVSSS